MAGGVAYVDSSALVKLIVTEPESAALRQAASRWQRWASAALVRTETIRALRRSGNERYVATARRLLHSVHLVRIDDPLLDRAGDLDPPDLRSLDAIHLASALSLGTDIGIMFVYDRRLEAAARLHGFATSSPA